jgi:hypothetical protein
MLLLRNYISIRFINHKLSSKIMKEENDSQLTNMVSSYASPVHEVAQKLREEDYDIAGRAKVRQFQPDPDMIRILKDREPIQRSLFGFKMPFLYRKQRALDLGTIWINNKENGAHEDKKWILEINKSQYDQKLIEIANNLSSSYGVQLEVIKFDKKPGRETYLHELY